MTFRAIFHEKKQLTRLAPLIYQDEGWKLYRTNYYQEGWLATGNARGLVGVTFTTSHCRTRTAELPLRANYNLRGHRSEVSIAFLFELLVVSLNRP